MASLPSITYPSFQHKDSSDLAPRERTVAAQSPSPLPPRTHSLTPPPQSPSAPPHHSATTALPPPQPLPQTQSPLFAALPLGIRRQIYTALVGGTGVLVSIVRGQKRLSAIRYGYIVGRHEHVGFNSDRFCFPNGEPGRQISTVMDRPPGVRSLSLIKTCRRVYAESVDLIYSVPTFLVHDVFIMPSWAETTLPHRFDSIRSLYLNFTTSQFLSGHSELREDMWQSTWAVIAGTKGLRVLRVVLSSHLSKRRRGLGRANYLSLYGM